MSDWGALLASYGLEATLGSTQGAQLARFETDLLRFGRARNLISRRDPAAQLSSLIAESIAAAFAYAPGSARRGADLGSGAGLPGMVWAILHPELQWVLIERRRARADFLERERRALQLDRLSVAACDASEVAKQESFTPFDLVLAKAVARPQKTLQLGLELLRPGAELVLFGRPNWNPDKAFHLEGWQHRELSFEPAPAGPRFAAAALHCFRRLADGAA
jgi:16S rRNA (guanine527-N7)-methyltransferase